MELTFKKDIYEQMCPVWSGTVSRDFTAECIVPDAMPDVGTVVDGEGVIITRSKECEAGCLTLTASVSAWVMYMPDGGGTMESVPITIPVEMKIDAPGADTDCQAVTRLRIRSMEARMVNSRKLSLRADVDCEARVYRRTRAEVASGLDKAERSVHLLTGTAPATVVADVREKSFVVTDEYQMPQRPEKLLSQRLEAVTEDVKYTAGKAVFRGRLRAGLIFAGADGQVYAGRYETEFSQIMEVDAGGEEALPELVLMTTGAYFDLPDRQDEEGKVSAEIHLVAQCICRRTEEVSYIADIYSNRTELVSERSELPMAGTVRPVTMRQTVTGTVEQMGVGGEAIALSASIGSVTVEGGTVRTAVNLRIICRMGTSFTLARSRLAAEFTTDLPEGTTLTGVTVSAADLYCSQAGGGMDVRAVLQMDAMAVTAQTVSCVTAVTEDAEAWAAQPAAPSVTLVRVAPGEDMWAVARKYRSTVEAIVAANGDRTEGLLLIPKAR